MKVQIVLTILEDCWVGIKTSTITVASIPGRETSVISVIHEEFVQVEFQVKLFELRWHKSIWGGNCPSESFWVE